MRDPYHSARVRFKVARDRLNDETVRSHVPSQRAAVQRNNKDALTRHRGILLMSHECVAAAARSEYNEATGILLTMLRFKLTDERHALMLFKLSRE